jgi:uncharacterized repeat protein (TIGR03803 family)
VFTVGQDGGDYRVLHEFLGGPDDGNSPKDSPILVGSRFVGTTTVGGDDDLGVVYSMNLDGSDFRLLHEFSGVDGVAPLNGLTEIGGRLFGTTLGGDDSSGGVVFSLAPDGTGFRVLHDLRLAEGVAPVGALVHDEDRLYGVTLHSDPGAGVVFSLQLDGSDFEVLHRFLGAPDGGNPDAGMLKVGNMIYGTTKAGGAFDNGTIFAIPIPEPSALALAAWLGVVLLTRRSVRAAFSVSLYAGTGGGEAPTSSAATSVTRCSISTCAPGSGCSRTI